MPKALAANGPALLRFPDGRSVNVDARLQLNRNFFSVSGDGVFVTDSATASHAFLCEGSLLLTVNGSAMAEIVVHETKTIENSARCWFRVHS